MLVLGLNPDESAIVLNPDGTKLGTIKRIKHPEHNNRIGFEFPREYKIKREKHLAGQDTVLRGSHRKRVAGDLLELKNK